MGRIGEIVEYRDVTVDGDKAGEITVDLGAGDVVTVIDATPAGYFTKPQKGDLAIVVEVDGAQEYALLGIIDVSKANGTSEGEVLVYARRTDGSYGGFVQMKTTGETKIANQNAQIVIDNDGSITLENANNTITMTAAGVAVNGHLTVAVE